MADKSDAGLSGFATIFVMELSGLELELSVLTGTDWAILTYLIFMLLSLYRAADERKFLFSYEPISQVLLYSMK